MAIRIDRIKVNRGGPLETDFLLEPGDVNLVYGHNETGKSYIVEAIINLLFRTGRNWKLRRWDLAGSIGVSGIQGSPVKFSRTGKKLEDYWEREIGLPQDFSRLLVVREGETRLADKADKADKKAYADKEDGVGRDILKNYLSGEGLLDGIHENISKTLREASVQNRRISGDKRGKLKDRDEVESNLEKIDGLLTEAQDGYASGAVDNLRIRQEALEAEFDRLGKAKRHHAALLAQERTSLLKKQGALPSEQELSQFVEGIGVYESVKSQIDYKSQRATALESNAESYKWAEKALGVYKDIAGSRPAAGLKQVYMIVALLFLAGAAVTGFLNLSIALGVCLLGSLTFSILHFKEMKRALATAGTNKDLEDLKAGFKNRYGHELTDRALLEDKLDDLREDYLGAKSLRQELDENLKPELKKQEGSIKVALKQYTSIDLSPEQWRLAAGKLRGELNEVNDAIGKCRVELASLDVAEEEYLYEDPGTEWDLARYRRLDKELSETKEELGQQRQTLNSLKARVQQEVSSDSSEWEDLITVLQKKREAVAQECRDATAEILAKIQVNKVVEEFRQEEDERIVAGLESEEVTKPLYAITGSYRSIRYEADRGLVLTTDQDEDYDLADISTGAKEQALLALRMGFSSIAMKGQTAFLILDDAFQHSDWRRRRNLMDQVLRIVTSGWQVFYFTMDDHIRDLFLEAGEKLGDRFVSRELC